MTSRMKYVFIAFFAMVIFACTTFLGVDLLTTKTFASDETVITRESLTGKYLDDEYISVYKVPTSIMTYENNGGEQGGNTLSKAFDGNWGTGWVSGKDNVNGLINSITINFNRAVTIESILYQCSSARDGYGYPQKLKIYVANNSELELLGQCNSTPTSNRVAFKFSEPVTVTQLVFEFTQVTTYHKWCATAQEIQFIQPYNESIDKVLNMFEDYSQFVVKKELVSKIGQLRNSVKNEISYESALKPLLDRADAVIAGYLVKDVHREFQTNPDARNPINQYGNMANYARNELLLNSIGTNRQVIGIGGATGEQITVYVEAEDGDPLPQLAFTQIYGAWNSWMSTVSLKRGKNIFTFPNFKGGGSYSVAINAGGPIHVINPYTPEQQSSNVKLYFEGGYIYPVFHDGDDESTFKIILEDYYKRLKDPNNNVITIDAFEAVSDSIILSCRATNAYDGYINRGWSPQENINRWTNYVLKMLSFCGVDCRPGGTYYDERNEHITINYRAVQPYAGMYAFAAGEHIGIPDAGSHVAMIMRTNPGWAFAHEFGHTVDLRGRIWGEVTNNMWAIHDRYMIEGLYDDRISIGQVSSKLASDFSSNKNTLWEFGNCAIWYMIEGGYPGYWAGSENAYRYEKKRDPDSVSLINQLGNTERMIYYGSIGANDDLREYFERWGFYMNGDSVFNSGNRWSRAKQTSALSTLMTNAKANGKIEGNGKKYWYLDINQYKYLKENNEELGDWASCYSSTDIVEVVDIMNSSDSHTLILPTPKDTKAHLGYEIQSKIGNEWKVVGFTYNSSFTDTYNYGSTSPTYRVFAYDRALNCSGQPQEVTANPETQTNVCKIGETYYNNLKEAVNAAQPGAIIVLLKDCKDGNININKNLSICPDNSLTESVKITKNAAGNLFNITARCTLAIGNTSGNGATIILDGNNFIQNGSLIKTGNGTINLNNVKLCNNNTTGWGGAIYTDYGATVNLFKTIIDSNTADCGGGIYLNGVATINLRETQITNNTAKNRGGALYEREYQGTSSFNNNGSRTSRNIISGNSAVYGGAIYTENNVNLFNVEITENTATYGGAFYVDIDNNGRCVGLTTCTVINNTASFGSAFYLNRGKTILNGGTYNGNFYKVLGKNPASKLNFNMAFPNLEGAEFELPSIAEDGTILFDEITGNLTLTQEQVDSIVIKNGHGVLTGNSIVAHRNILTLTIKYGNSSFEIERPMGNFILPECIPEFDESKYFTNWVIEGVSYNTGDTINLIQNITLQADVKNYCKVTMKYGTSTDVKYFKEGDVYYMPMNTPDGKAILSFDCSNGQNYVYADGAVITGDLVFTANIKKLINITLVIGKVRTVSSYEYNRTVILTTPQAPKGQYFRHWLIDGEIYKGNSSIKLTKDVTAKAVFSDLCQIKAFVEGVEKILEYQPNSLLKLYIPDEVEGKIFRHWLIDNVIYFAGADYLVTKDVSIYAVYETVSSEEGTKASITLQVMRNGSNDNPEIVEWDIGSKYVLPKPEVDEGKVFLHWTINGIKYHAGDEVLVTQDFTAEAEIVNSDDLTNTQIDYLVKNITIKGKEETEISRYRLFAKVGETIVLSKPEQSPKGYEIDYYIVNNERKNIGDSVEITIGIDFKAVYKPITEKSNLPVGAIVGAVAAVAGVSILTIVIVLLKRKKKIGKFNKA